MSASGIHQLPLHEKHVERHARFGQFGHWEVPLYYTSIMEEHHAVRRRAGLFDISHMGEFLINGPQATRYLNDLLPRDLNTMPAGKAWYMPLLNESGGIMDDIILYRRSAEEYCIIVNASNVDKDFDWLESRRDMAGVRMENLSEGKGLLALQGPRSEKILEKVLGCSLSSLKYYSFTDAGSWMIARTGYTGEDGFEIMVDRDELSDLWERLFAAGSSEGLLAAGFGARDTLRLEAGMPLHGHEMDEQISPLEAGIAWACDLKKEPFLGREALLSLQAKGISRKLVGFEMIERGIPRHGQKILKAGQEIGRVTSGSFAPTLEKNIGMGYVPSAEAREGNPIQIAVRDVPLQAQIVKMPFYHRIKK